MKKIAVLTVFVFVLIICFYLVACGRKNNSNSLVVLVNSVPAQQRYLKEEVFYGFEKLYNVKVSLINYETDEELINLLSQDSVISQISLASVPLEMKETLVNAGKFTPFSEIVAESVLKFDAETYYEKFLEFGRINGEYFFFPHRIEVPVLFYLKNKVLDAQNKFQKYRREINRVLKTENGFGLPESYVFEENPNDWDLYDIFVLGYIWAKEEINGKKIGRILSPEIISSRANILADYSAALGASDKSSEYFVKKAKNEVRLWDKNYNKYGIFNPLSHAEEISPVANYRAIKNGEIFMAYFLQNDCFNVLEGTDESNMQPYFSDLSDVGIALTPSAVSFSLDENGKPKIIGRRVSTINGFGWGIPRNAREKELAYHLMQYLNNRNQHTRETIRFGAIPVREDVLLNMQNIYGDRWLGEGYATALYQITNFFTGKKEKQK
jgi:ABC-type glycerol-3-phosphate transport system substrate-binding protein